MYYRRSPKPHQIDTTLGAALREVFRRLPGISSPSASIAIYNASSTAPTRRSTQLFADMLPTGELGSMLPRTNVRVSDALRRVSGMHSPSRPAARGIEVKAAAVRCASSRRT